MSFVSGECFTIDGLPFLELRVATLGKLLLKAVGPIYVLGVKNLKAEFSGITVVFKTVSSRLELLSCPVIL